ncbi:hypothetical protein BC831DRAFT_554988 [Entophlyctis helioformis]|nr:hypothetical protein BC831DRAFT_554988 [Entophlyctis helioformis]
MLAWALLSIVKNEWNTRKRYSRTLRLLDRRARLDRPSIQDLAASVAIAATHSRGNGINHNKRRTREWYQPEYMLPREVFERLVMFLDPSDTVNLLLICQAWSGPAAEAIYQSPRLHGPDAFAKFTQLITSRQTTHPYALMVNELALEGSVADDILMGDLKAALMACTNLLRFRLKGSSHVSNLIAQFLAEYLPHLVHLELPGCPISDSFMSSLVRGCRNLRHVDFSFTNMTLASIPLLLRDCRHLESLDLTGVLAPPVGWNGYDLAFAPPGSQSSSSEAKLSSSPADPSAFAAGPPSFERPNLSRVSLSRTDASDATIRFLTAHCPNLEQVYVDACPLITDQALVYIAQHCPQLSHLDCSYSTLVTDIGIQALAVHLSAAYANPVTGTGYSVSRAASAAAAAAAASTKRREGPKLKEINLSGCFHVTPKAVCLLAEKCPALEVMVMDGCDRLLDWYYQDGADDNDDGEGVGDGGGRAYAGGMHASRGGIAARDPGFVGSTAGKRTFKKRLSGELVRRPGSPGSGKAAQTFVAPSSTLSRRARRSLNTRTLIVSREVLLDRSLELEERDQQAALDAAGAGMGAMAIAAASVGTNSPGVRGRGRGVSGIGRGAPSPVGSNGGLGSMGSAMVSSSSAAGALSPTHAPAGATEDTARIYRNRRRSMSIS